MLQDLKPLFLKWGRRCLNFNIAAWNKILGNVNRAVPINCVPICIKENRFIGVGVKSRYALNIFFGPLK